MYYTCLECRAQLLVHPLKVHPDVLTQLLNIQPTKKLVKGDYLLTPRGNKRLIRHSLWTLVSDSEIVSDNLEEHLAWLIEKLQPLENVPLHLEKGLFQLSKSGENCYRGKKFAEIFMGIACSWYPHYDHGGPILSTSIMKSLATLNVQFSLGLYFTYEMSTIQAFMEAAERLGHGHDLSHHDWIHIVSFIKKFHHIPPSTLGTVCENGDFLDDDGNLICSIKDYIS